jgi:sugar O-acyltransferase (sialic acid O-acetyltransferase NeuD family)
VSLSIGWDGFCEWIEGRETSKISFAVAIGGDRGEDRLQIAAHLLEAGLTAAKTIHPSAYVSPTSRPASGCQALAHCTVGVDVKIADHCIVNTGAVVDHECELGAGVHIGPGATLAGCVTVGECTFIGTNATVLPRIRIGRNVTVGAGTVVTRDIADYSVVYGVPARTRSMKTLAIPT